MAISYPLSVPNYEIASIQLIAQNAIGVSTSIFSYQSQIVDHGGDRWLAQVSLPIRTKAEAADWQAFLASLRGRYGTFLLGDSSHTSPQGAGGGTPRVNVGSQSGLTLLTDGWPINTLVLKAGDYFSVENRLYLVTADATSGGDGGVEIDIWPALRDGGPADNALLTVSAPKGLFRLSSNAIAIADADAGKLYNISFAAEEAL